MEETLFLVKPELMVAMALNGRMVDEEAYCIDVLTQVSAVTKALESVALTLLEDHLGHCVAEAVGEGGPVAQEKLREANAAIARLVRS